jgi:hypothetical protein
MPDRSRRRSQTKKNIKAATDPERVAANGRIGLKAEEKATELGEDT